MSEHLQRARVRLLLEHPFFGVLAIHLMEREYSEIDNKMQEMLNGYPATAGTDGRHLFVNPEWLDKLSEEEKKGLLAHEVMHVALGHLWPWRIGGREALVWNLAGDHVINLLLRDAGLSLPPEGLWDDKYDGLSTEQVYEILKQEQSDQGGSGSGQEKPDLSMRDILPPDAGGKSDSGDDSKDENSGSNGDGESGEMPIGTMTEDEQKQLEREWKEKMVSAAMAAKLRGKLPAGIDRLVDGLLAPKIPWQTLLQQFVNDVIRDDYDLQRPDRRFLWQGIYLPDLYSEGAHIVVAVDTSGSISEEDTKSFLSEAIGILNSRNVTSIRLMACDAEVGLDIELNPYDPIPAVLPGGGGTDFRPVFELAMDNPMKRPACIIYLTDLWGTFPEEPPQCPVIWVATSDEEVPWGFKIDYEVNETA